MMINFAVLDEADEYPRELGSRHYLPPGAVELPAGVTLAQAAKMRVLDGVWVDRPALAAPSVTVGEAATVVTFKGLPGSTICMVLDGETGEILAALAEVAGGVEIELSDTGPYYIEAVPPLPYLDHRMTVLV